MNGVSSPPRTKLSMYILCRNVLRFIVFTTIYLCVTDEKSTTQDKFDWILILVETQGCGFSCLCSTECICNRLRVLLIYDYNQYIPLENISATEESECKEFCTRRFHWMKKLRQNIFINVLTNRQYFPFNICGRNRKSL